MCDKHQITEEPCNGKLLSTVLKSSGSREGVADFTRSCHDSIEQAFIRLKNGRDTWVLDADIKGFFDNVDHESMLSMIGTFPKKELIKEWLKAGFIDGGVHNPTETGTPQGGVISPLLANIGLHGLEQFIKSINPKLGIIRYADDFIVTARDKEPLEQVLILIKQWLSKRDLEISAEKTRVVNIKDGFNFLGFNLRQYNGKLLIKPQKEKVLAFCKRIRTILSTMKTQTQKEVIGKINPLLRGFANYYRGVVSKEIFGYIRNRVKIYLWCWATRRHPNKSKKWVKSRYYSRLRGDNWTFMCKGTGRKGKEKSHILDDTGSTPIVRHIKVKRSSSPDDPTLQEYWKKRATDCGKKHWAKGSKYEAIAKLQNWKCPVCGDNLFNGEPIETHHIVLVAEGGSDGTENLQHLHAACHKQVHSRTKSTGLK